MQLIDLKRIKQYFSTQPVSKAWLFGSFARNEQTDESDVDILVSFDKGVSLLRHAAIACDLEDLLNRQVDLVTEGTLYPEVLPSVNKDRILIYERGA